MRGCAVRWLARIGAIFQAGTDYDDDFLTEVNRDAFLTGIMLY
jgi:hypothetical protein